VIERIPKGVVIAAFVLGPVALTYLAYSRPAYFTNQIYLGGLLFLELMTAAIWMYRRLFFPIVIIVFLLAGVDVPLGSVWRAERWVILGVGAFVGLIIMLKDRGHHFGLFHAVALLAILSALVSAAVSTHTNVSILKVLSLLLLFVYAGTGARLAVTGRENRFFAGLLAGCEVLAGVLAASYLLGIELMGNPNSLGAVTGVVVSPVLLWGTLVTEKPFVRHRRSVLCAISLYLTFASHARAGMAAAFVSCGLLCLVLRRYRLLMQGIMIIIILAAAAAILQPEAFSRTVSTATSRVIYKRDDPRGLLASREAPWQHAVDSIRKHFWFGTGFGTSDNAEEPTENAPLFSSPGAATTENGSSYLAITTWVGMLGVLPFLMLLLILSRKIFHTGVWTARTGNLSQPAILLALIMIAGLIHAGLEDWLFAPGYYLCVFYWSMAFVFVDYAPSLVPADFRRASWRTGTTHPRLSDLEPIR
jgi:O-antigen ligase